MSSPPTPPDMTSAEHDSEMMEITSFGFGQPVLLSPQYSHSKEQYPTSMSHYSVVSPGVITKKKKKKPVKVFVSNNLTNLNDVVYS